MLDPDVARAIREGVLDITLEYTTRTTVLDPVLARAIRSAPKLRDYGYDMPPRRPGRDYTDKLLRDALIREAVSWMMEQGHTKHRAIIEITAVLPMQGKKAIEAVVYADPDLIRKASGE